MIGAVVTSPPKAQGAKRAAKPKTPKRGVHKVTRGEKSVTQPGQQHGELLNMKAPTEHQMMKARAQSTMRQATNDWVEGKIGGREHEQIHARAKHVMRGRKPRDF